MLKIFLASNFWILPLTSHKKKDVINKRSVKSESNKA